MQTGTLLPRSSENLSFARMTPWVLTTKRTAKAARRATKAAAFPRWEKNLSRASPSSVICDTSGLPHLHLIQTLVFFLLRAYILPDHASSRTFSVPCTASCAETSESTLRGACTPTGSSLSSHTRPSRFLLLVCLAYDLEASWMDSRKCQTPTAAPNRAGGSPDFVLGCATVQQAGLWYKND